MSEVWGSAVMWGGMFLVLFIAAHVMDVKKRDRGTDHDASSLRRQD